MSSIDYNLLIIEVDMLLEMHFTDGITCVTYSDPKYLYYDPTIHFFPFL